MRVMERALGSLFGEEEMAAIRRVLDSGGSASWGPERESFEKEFCEFTGARHAVAMSSCTAALNICAQLLRLGPGDEVICSPQSFWATISALVQRRVTIRFGDIDPTTLNLCPQSVERLLNSRTRAIYVLHYGGNPAELDPIRALAGSHGAVVVEDCAHAVGASYKGQRIGSGQLCCFSFQSLKNMSTLGEGGMLTTDNPLWAQEAARLRVMGVVGQTRFRPPHRPGPFSGNPLELHDHAFFPPLGNQPGWYELVQLEEIGTKCYLSEIQAAVGRVQLRRLERLNSIRASIAARYSDALSSTVGLRPTRVAPHAAPAWHLYACLIDPLAGIERDRLIYHMQKTCGIQIVLRYWPLHLNPVLAYLGHRRGEAPECERVWFDQQVNLPISAAMQGWEIDAVVEALHDAMLNCRS
jgi:perosamine synthetase